MSEFHAGTTRVSMAEMNANPMRTVQIIHEWEGWEWASRLLEHWHGTLPMYGVQHLGLWNTS